MNPPLTCRPSVIACWCEGAPQQRASRACAMAMEELDPAYEFDAPRFYDFRRDDEGTSFASRWFDAQDDEQGAVHSSKHA